MTYFAKSTLLPHFLAGNGFELLPVDWLAETESHFLGHSIAITWHINYM